VASDRCNPSTQDGAVVAVEHAVGRREEFCSFSPPFKTLPWLIEFIALGDSERNCVAL
jgi:hypothetical protein